DPQHWKASGGYDICHRATNGQRREEKRGGQGRRAKEGKDVRHGAHVSCWIGGKERRRTVVGCEQGLEAIHSCGNRSTGHPLGSMERIRRLLGGQGQGQRTSLTSASDGGGRGQE